MGRSTLAIVLLSASSALHAQRPLVARADSAWGEGDRTLARRLYGEALAKNPDESHAVFRLAQLTGDAHESVSLYERYTRLESGDAWGYMALGDALARLARFGEALAAYERAAHLAPSERDLFVGRARVYERAGKPAEASAVLRDWVAQHADDGEVWDMLGRDDLRMGRPGAAAQAFEHARSLGYGHGVEQRIRAARAQSAPAVEPAGGYQRDSDGNETSRGGLSADAAVADGVRLGVTAHASSTGDGAESVQGMDGAVQLTARPRSNVQLQLAGGLARFNGVDYASAWSTVTGEARLRVRAPRDGVSLDLRAQRLPLGTSPLLIANEAVRNEARATIELPFGPFRVRGSGRAGNVTAVGEGGNTRVGGDAALVLPLGRRVSLSGQYHRLGYNQSSSAGYFAPHLVETREAGLYFEAGDEGVTFAADVGAGAQRVTPLSGDVPGAWTRALRGWSFLTIPIAPGRAIWVETEAYDAPFSTEGVSTSSSWRFFSVSTGLQFALR